MNPNRWSKTRVGMIPAGKKAVASALGLFLLLAAVAQGAPVTKEHAARAAATFITKTYPAPDKSKAKTVGAAGSSHLGIKKTDPVTDAGQTIGFAVTLEPSGYVLLSADDEAPAIKMHSDKGSFEGLPPELLKVLRAELAEDLDTLKKLKEKRAPGDPRHRQKWVALAAPESQPAESLMFTAASANTVLLTTTWSQGDPYNYYCPVLDIIYGQRALAGCNAIALAQILRYWQQPMAVSQDHTYTDVGTGTLSISDAGLGAYNWDMMPDAISPGSPVEQKRAVGQLVYHAAVAVESDFGLSATWGNISSHQAALSTYFNFDAGGVEWRGSFTRSQWYDKIKADVDASRPVDYAMSGTDAAGGGVGHSLVCDGYRNGNEIHLNFGWSGSADAWYNMDSVDGGGFTWTGHWAVFGIVPRNSSVTHVNAAYTASDANGSLAKPYSTVNRGYQAAKRSSIIRIAGGNYPEAVTMSKPLLLEAYNGQATIGVR